MRMRARFTPARCLRWLPALIFLIAARPVTAIDLRSASVERLGNGLTIILLEDRNFPVVSLQMLYRTGARDETTGRTGLAHFLEHMAFRSSENFPDTQLVSAIYAHGGEWHGYTWTDQTTYFATVPQEHLDLLLRIEADRMVRLDIAEHQMEAEKGAVLAELHMYENDPATSLLDAIMYVSFLGHPYRNNTIGWESDIRNLGHADVVEFYRRHYHPANAVLAVVGAFDAAETRARIRELFAGFEAKAPTPLPHTVEPEQTGERRFRLSGDTDVKRFMIGYRAPSTTNPDFAAFLVLQDILGASSGVNFLQNDWGTPIRADALLDGAAENLTTWYPPSAQDYLFVIGGTASSDAVESEIEQAIEDRVARLRRDEPEAGVVSAAIERVLDELIYDVETTEDAAHQLAFFDGLHALDTLFDLPRRIAAVTGADVRRAARSYLLAERRTIGWYAARTETHEAEIAVAATTGLAGDATGPRPEPDRSPLPAPVMRRLRGGITAIVQQADTSPAAYVKIVLPAKLGAARDDPIHGYSSFDYRLRPNQLAETLTHARATLAKAAVDAPAADAPSKDPETRLEQSLQSLMPATVRAPQGLAVPVLIVVSGDLDAELAFRLLDASFGDITAQSRATRKARAHDRDDITVPLNRPIAQAWIGYILPAPGPRERLSDAYRVALYILSHGYEGRLGKKAISDRGLAYYIDGRYRSDGENGWITFAAGVDPGKVELFRELMTAEFQRFIDHPPTAAEVAEAKNHFLGRARSAAQSNQELATRIAREWLWYGRPQSLEDVQRRLKSLTRGDVSKSAKAFVSGTMIVVKE